ncbi:vacuolar protein sorting-associated protein 51homolog [Lichtheimia corymbifera JMRC:FSU:9682]|uniref:Vacuolar protein sorting-associated protein 51 homolog n=1 Tax=Lichtheimia corymbifera JMRC:FSU:9682 TaxID=1263082 RepID=A0A068RGH9_9FUNG|nr:vacuolar protein sorting-associated protein 51homolog [Lichtheimia corymbifera JMRC:FSU:9682]
MSDPPRTSPPERKGRSRERNVNLLKYYGISGSAAGDNRQPLDIDSDTFEPNKYFSRLLKEKTLSGLIKRDNELVAEIREIDGDMKTLVYENYSKFISATDTIRKMKSNVESMESEMSRLNDSMNSITQQCTNITNALGPNREKIQRLTNVHNLLKRLQFIFELPDRLGRCLANGHYAQAVKYYTKAKRLLNHYQHLSAFKGIERDSETIINKIRDEIWKNAKQPDRKLDDMAEDMRLLLLLQEDPPKLWKEYLDVQVARLNTCDANGVDSVDELTSKALMPLEDTAKHFESLFLKPVSTEEEASIPYDKDQAKNDLMQAITPHIDAFFQKASEYTKLQTTSMDGQQTLDQIKHLHNLTASVSENASALVRLAAIDKRMQALMDERESGFIDGLMFTSVDQLKARMTRLDGFSLDTIEGISTNKNALNDFIYDTASWLIQHIETECLGSLRNMLDTLTPESQPNFLVHIGQSVERMWQSLLDTISGDKLDNDNAVKLIVGSRLCYDLAEHIIPEVYSNLPGKDAAAAANDDESREDAHNMMEQYIHKGQSLLNKQTMQEGFRLTLLIQNQYLRADRLDGKPERVSQAWVDAFERVRYIEQLFETVYPQTPSPEGNGGGGTEMSDMDYEHRFGSTASEGLYTRPTQSTHSLTTTSSETPGEVTGLGIIPKFGYDMTQNMMSNIDKLFAERVDIYRSVDPTPVGVCAGVLRMLLKAFLETVRQMRLKQSDYQQLQLDVEYLRLMMWPYTQHDNKWMSSMLQEIISGAHTRCETPKPLNPEDVESILSLVVPS